MAPENVEIVRGAYEAFNQGRQEEMLGFLDPEIEWDESDLPARRLGIYRGHAGVKRLLDENSALWTDINIVIDEVIDTSDDRVVAFIRAKGRGRHTGVDVELASAQVWTLHSGKAVQVRLYLERADALEAVGLR
jgi:ketosteroid isomerase-like protein